MVLYFKLKKYFKANNELANDIINSISYKVGYFVTYPVRFISDVLKGKKTVLFHQNLPDNGFSEKFEQQWVNLINSNITNKYSDHQPEIRIYDIDKNDLDGYIDEFDENGICGWFRNKNDISQRLQIYIYVNNEKIGVTVCSVFRQDLLDIGLGDGHYGFKLEFDKPLKDNYRKVNVKVLNKPNYGEEVVESIVTLGFNSNKQLPNRSINYDGCFDDIDGFDAIGWVVNIADHHQDISVNLFRNNELINIGKANIYRHDLRLKFPSHHNKAFRLKIPLVELLKGKATFKVCTTDKYEIGRIEYDPTTKNQQVINKLNSPKVDLLLPYYDGFIQPKSWQTNQKIAIHIHVFYLDVFDEICLHVKQIKFNFDLYLSTTAININEVENYLMNHNLKALKIVKTPNRGRDVAPFIIEFGEDLLKYDVALHLHTKKTIHNESLGKLWLQNSLNCLVRDNTYVAAVLEIFNQLDNVGIIAPKLLGELVLLYNWGDNYNTTKNFLKNLKINTKNLNPNEVEFPAGTMFWFKPKALEFLLKANIRYNDFPQEPIAGDGTFAHAIERSMYYIIESSGYTYHTAEPVNPNVLHNEVNNIVISIIIPVYNGQKWLFHSVQSILQQTQFLDAFEVLIVDNNSTDDSSKIAKMYSTLYRNIHYYHQPIKGAGNARNMGIENAKGKYVFFLDVDDVLDNRALQNLMDLAYDGKSDLIVSPLIIFNENHFNNPSPEYLPNSNFIIETHTLKTKSAVLNQETSKYLNEIFSDFGPCAKLFKRQFLIDNNIVFPENLNYEDNYFIYKAYLAASNISICGEPTYLYRKLSAETGTTQSTSFNESDLLDQCKILMMLIELLGKKENRIFKTIGYHRIIIKLVWLFLGIKKLPNKNSSFYPKLSQVLSHFSKLDFEEAAKKYAPTKKFIIFFNAIKNKKIDLAISIFSSI